MVFFSTTKIRKMQKWQNFKKFYETAASAMHQVGRILYSILHVPVTFIPLNLKHRTSVRILRAQQKQFDPAPASNRKCWMVMGMDTAFELWSRNAAFLSAAILKPKRVRRARSTEHTAKRLG